MAGSAHHRGDMDIAEQKATFDLFMGLTKWSSLVLAAVILFLVVWLCTDSSFIVGAVSGLVVLVVGWVALKKRPGPAH